jgi:endonuclease YncB( thermonuclease family)
MNSLPWSRIGTRGSELSRQRSLYPAVQWCLAAALFTCAQACAAASISGVVERVFDGDSAQLRTGDGGVTIRLHGVDAPERGQAHAESARRALSELVLHAQVDVEVIDIDQYDRYVGIVRRGDVIINEALLEAGHAWAYRGYLGQVAGDALYCELEAEAREAERGLWSAPARRWLPPWDYRAYERGEKPRLRDYERETAQQCQAAMRFTPGERRELTLSEPPAPEGCRIKGNISPSGDHIYHVPGDRSYGDTRINESKGERWFCSESDASAAGWRRARR